MLLKLARSAIAEKSDVVLAALLHEMLDDALEIVHVWGAMHACSNSHAAHALQRLLKRAPNPILLSRFTPESLEDFAEFTKMLATSLSKRGKCSHKLLLLAQQQQP